MTRGWGEHRGRGGAGVNKKGNWEQEGEGKGGGSGKYIASFANFYSGTYIAYLLIYCGAKIGSAG